MASSAAKANTPRPQVPLFIFRIHQQPLHTMSGPTPPHRLPSTTLTPLLHHLLAIFHLNLLHFLVTSSSYSSSSSSSSWSYFASPSYQSFPSHRIFPPHNLFTLVTQFRPCSSIYSSVFSSVSSTSFSYPHPHSITPTLPPPPPPLLPNPIFDHTASQICFPALHFSLRFFQPHLFLLTLCFSCIFLLLLILLLIFFRSCLPWRNFMNLFIRSSAILISSSSFLFLSFISESSSIPFSYSSFFSPPSPSPPSLPPSPPPSPTPSHPPSPPPSAPLLPPLFPLSF